MKARPTKEEAHMGRERNGDQRTNPTTAKVSGGRRVAWGRGRPDGFRPRVPPRSVSWLRSRWAITKIFGTNSGDYGDLPARS
jgi:hypothetical protein